MINTNNNWNNNSLWLHSKKTERNLENSIMGQGNHINTITSQWTHLTHYKEKANHYTKSYSRASWKKKTYMIRYCKKPFTSASQTDINRVQPHRLGTWPMAILYHSSPQSLMPEMRATEGHIMLKKSCLLVVILANWRTEMLDRTPF